MTKFFLLFLFLFASHLQSSTHTDTTAPINCSGDCNVDCTVASGCATDKLNPTPINCDDGFECNIFCENDFSCQHRLINGPNNGILNITITGAATADASSKPLNERIEAILNRSKVMLFMKG